MVNKRLSHNYITKGNGQHKSLTNTTCKVVHTQLKSPLNWFQNANTCTIPLEYAKSYSLVPMHTLDQI